MQGYYVAAGTNTMGLSAAGGLGYATAGWIVGQRGMPADSYDLELSRFLGLHNNRRFLRDRVMEVPGKCGMCVSVFSYFLYHVSFCLRYAL